MVSHHPPRFSGHRYCGSEDITVLVYHVILKAHGVYGLGNFLCRSF